QANDLFFMAGLGSFLVAHVLLIILYGKLKTEKGAGLNGPQKARASFPIILAGTGLIVILYPTLGELRIPVIIYAFTLMVMVLRATYRYGFTSKQSFWNVTTGALLFMISDSLLAINKFFQPTPYSGILIMVSYMGAVYFITKGVMAHRQY
ncbi:MAG TPA: lysoplasmalogenase, partial [Cytophagales bacterium]|nr:lysoplasmalogenase [Cytophagales bacterium]